MKLKLSVIVWIILVGILGIMVADALAVGDLKDYYDTGDDTAENCRGSQWCAQTLISTSNYTLNEIHIYGKRVGTPGTCTIQLRDVSSDDPGSTVHTSASVDGNALALTDAWITFDVTDYDITNATNLAVVLSCPSGSAGNQIAWRMDSGNGYSSGHYHTSPNSGSTWTSDTTYDFMFRLYGTTTTGGGGTTTTATSTDEFMGIQTRNAFNGLILFFISFFGIIFYFKKGGDKK